jgi:hypothetical protein
LDKNARIVLGFKQVLYTIKNILLFG